MDTDLKVFKTGNLYVKGRSIYNCISDSISSHFTYSRNISFSFLSAFSLKNPKLSLSSFPVRNRRRPPATVHAPLCRTSAAAPWWPSIFFSLRCDASFLCGTVDPFSPRTRPPSHPSSPAMPSQPRRSRLSLSLTDAQWPSLQHRSLSIVPLAQPTAPPPLFFDQSRSHRLFFFQ